MAWGGLYLVSESAPGTTALTGVVLDRRRTHAPFDPPIAGVRVTLESGDIPGVSVLPSPVRIETVSDRQGGFAFIDVPALPIGTCYRTSVSDPRLPKTSSTDPMWPGEQYEQDFELPPEGADEGESSCFAGPRFRAR